jgi:nicotinate-nucleotide adenylyltransferase
MNYNIFIRGFTLIALLLGNLAFAQDRIAQVTSEKGFKELNETLRYFQAKLNKEFGLESVYIGGGSSRAILDHIYFGKPLEMRDLDVFVVAGKEVVPEYARSIGMAAEGDELGRFSEENLRPRPRANPDLPVPERYAHNAGYGFFYLKEHQGRELIFDLSIYHSQNDLKLNGIVDFDMVMIKLDHGQDLASWARTLQTNDELVPIEKLASTKKIVDHNNGYQSWVQKKFKVINWANVEADPSQVTIRVARSLGKIGISEVPEEDAARLRKLISSQAAGNNLQFVRNTLKLLEDKAAAEELKILASVGAFQTVSPQLQLKLQALKVDEIRLLLEKADNFYMGLSNAPPLDAQRLLMLIDDLPLVEKKVFFTELAKPALFPKYFGPLNESLEKVISAKKIGFYTGVFNPIHLGHLEVIEGAISKLGLDEIYIIPTPATTHNEVPISLEHRRKMVNLLAQRNPKIKIFPEELVHLLDKGTGNGIDALIRVVEGKEVGQPQWFHIMGSDSYLRFRENPERLKALGENPNRHLFVVQRPGEMVDKLIEGDVFEKVHFSQGAYGEEFLEVRSSTLIREKLKNKESIKSLVIPEIEDYIKSRGLYQLDCSDLFL